MRARARARARAERGGGGGYKYRDLGTLDFGLRAFSVFKGFAATSTAILMNRDDPLVASCS